MINDIAKAQLTAAHQEWLDNPTTQSAFDVIRKRRDSFKRTIQEGILVKSDEKEEIKLRSCINTCEGLLRILGSSDLFVDTLTNHKPQTPTE